MRLRTITQVGAVQPLGLSQPHVFGVLRGDFRKHLLDCLLRLLAVHGRDIDSNIREPRVAASGKPPIASSGTA